VWDFDANINAINQWTGDSFLIFGNDNRRTPTGFCGSLSHPLGQGFIATINWKFTEKVNVQNIHNENHPAFPSQYVWVVGSTPDTADF